MRYHYGMSESAQPKPKPKRRTQAERSAATRQLLLDATITCLVDRGYQATTTTEICRVARVSRGAQLHHYPTKEDLVAAALDHLYDQLRRDVLDQMLTLPDEADRVSALVDLLWAAYGDAQFKAVLELWMAARNDPSLHERVFPIMQHFREAMGPAVAVQFPAAAAREDFWEMTHLIFQLMQGMGLAKVVFEQDDDDAARPPLLRLLKRLVREAYEGTPAEETPPDEHGPP